MLKLVRRWVTMMTQMQSGAGDMRTVIATTRAAGDMARKTKTDRGDTETRKTQNGTVGVAGAGHLELPAVIIANIDTRKSESAETLRCLEESETSEMEDQGTAHLHIVSVIAHAVGTDATQYNAIPHFSASPCMIAILCFSRQCAI